MKRRVEYESKHSKSKEQVHIPSRENFEHYFVEFYKMFQHFKYNLVALNKKFDCLEKFFKVYQEEGSKAQVNKDSSKADSVVQDVCLDNLNFDFDNPSEEFSDVKSGKLNKKLIDQNKNIKVENEEFPFSVEDFEFITKNYIAEADTPLIGQKRASSSKKNSKAHVIIINKKKMIVEEDVNNFDNDLIDLNKKQKIKIEDVSEKKKSNHKDNKNFNSKNSQNSQADKFIKANLDYNKWIINKNNLKQENKELSQSSASPLEKEKEEADLKVKDNPVPLIKEKMSISDFLKPKKEFLFSSPNNNIMAPVRIEEDKLDLIKINKYY